MGCILSLSSCQFRACGDSGICVCNETVCDALEYVLPSSPMEYVLYTSSKSGERLTSTTGNFSSNIVPVSQLSGRISVNRTCQFQKMIGWGMAMTGSASINLAEMTPLLRNHVYRDYYSSQKGLNFNLLRMAIGGTDFDTEAWQYNVTPVNDTELTGLDELDAHDVTKVQQIQDLKNVSDIGENLKIVFSAWSPPPWMKTNNAFSGYGFLLKEYYPTWAQFHIKHMRLMKRHNITAYAITTGNEPTNALLLSPYVFFLSLAWLPNEQGEWIRTCLGPAVRNSEFASVKILASDDQRITLFWWLDLMGKHAMDYIDAIAVHWYSDKFTPPIFLDLVTQRYPEKPLINTESAFGASTLDTPGPALGSWKRSEELFERIEQDMMHSVTGWIEWNLVIDTMGGPNYVGNYVDGLVIFNRTAMEYYKQPCFYVLGHFSKFVPEGSVRICAHYSDISTTLARPKVSTLAFSTPNGSISLIISNRGETNATIIVSDAWKGTANITVMPRSINTMIYS